GRSGSPLAHSSATAPARATSPVRRRACGSSCSNCRPIDPGDVTDTRSHDLTASDRLAAVGLPAGRLLGSGMAGVVRDLGDGRIAKVWHRRTVEEVERLRAFYTALHESSVSSVRFPRILDIRHSGSIVVTTEALLDGTPLASEFPASGPTFDDVDHLVEALAA